MTVGQDAERSDAGQQDLDHRSEAGQTAAEPAVRRIDDERWQASWSRFQAAHDDHDATFGGPVPEPDPAAESAAADDAEPSVAPTEPTEPAEPAVPADRRPVAAEPPARPAAAPGPDVRTDRVVAAEPPDLPAAPPASSAADLTSLTLLRPIAPAPGRGWRRGLHMASRGALNPGPSRQERRRRDALDRVLTPVPGSHRVAVVSLKGGVGKTTIAAGLGLTLAQHRGDRVVALDANPEAGTLAERVTGEVAVSVRDLLANVGAIRTVADVSAYTVLTKRLQVVAADPVPDASTPLDETGYRTVGDLLSRFFSIVVTDSGTGVLHPAMAGILSIADSLVVVGGPSVDGSSRAAKTLDWLDANGYAALVRRSVAVLSSLRPETGAVNQTVLRRHFADRCRALVEVPFDPHLASGGVIDMDRLREPTSAAFVELAAVVAEGFALPPEATNG